MSTPRRRILRRREVEMPNGNGRPDNARLPAWQARLERERKAFDRWFSRLKRAFHALEKQQARIDRLERQIASAGHA